MGEREFCTAADSIFALYGATTATADDAAHDSGCG